MQVKVDVTESDDFPVISRQALFVLYNCARLSKILEKYKNEIDKGINLVLYKHSSPFSLSTVDNPMNE